jgi:dihydropteroate synthase
MVVGASRKASIARAAAGDSAVPAPGERLGASVGAAVLAYLHGAHVLRVHDVRETVQALRVAAAIRGATDAGTMLMAPR